ncbi:hypothetical protein EW145_g3016 [Phellinidium pouzarii]|uniref:Chromo domain-containing protein n=1 Tax=Phellinidium pouzarii TaxID=167371 RepID=A0A4S4LAN5_9AGAM|nr:hypothetical protein EW145_g3016 [Phellinidium pouzarii]
MKEPVVKTVTPSSSTKRNPDGGKKKFESLEVEVDEKTFKTTPIFDMFWRYTANRHAAEEKRRAGEPPPWSSDPALQTHKFCSIFRVADRGSQFLITEVIEKGSQLPEDILFRVLLYCSFVKIETYELLEEHLGPLTWSSYRQKKYAAVLQDAMDDGMTLYTGAFQKFPPRLGDSVSYINHLRLLEVMMDNGLLGKLMECEFMADAFDALYVYPSMGDFMTFQLLINLSYTPLLNFNENDFVIAGVGAMEGLRKCFSPTSLTRGSEEELIRWMTETQDEHFERLGLEFSGLGKRGRAMTLVDVEHTLCEVHKYSRLVSERSFAHGKRFTPVTEELPRYPALPKAWNHPARRLVRRRPGKYEHPQKQFVVSKILDKAIDENGNVIYFVDWQGYESSDRTWEPASILLEDAPLAVEDYENMHSADGSGARRKRHRRE